ncbi:MAG: pksN [Proteobacteria bacterium]|nr:pksN [Pseudomonadota bacterium]
MDADKKAGQDLRDGMRNLIEQELLAKVKARRPVVPAVPAGPAAAPAAAADRRLEEDVERLAIAALGVPAERFNARENLANYGVDSIAITELMAQISRFLAISIAPTTFFEAKHLNELCAILRRRYGPAIAAHYGAAAVVAPSVRTVPPAPAPILTNRPEEARHAPPVMAAGGQPAMAKWLQRHGVHAVAATLAVAEPAALAAAPVAIIAMAGKFPQSPDLETFRAHLRQGTDCIEEIPANRWDWRAVWGDPKKGSYSNVKYGGFVPGHDLFDAAFFNISPKEAELMDPQHRLFIECVWQLIESAGYAPGALAGRKVGIFLGINLQDYVDLANRQGLMEAVQMTGLGHVFCPNRLSFLLDVHGPSQVIDTACSSSLVAVHRALMSIRHEGCEMAVAGGANLMLTATQHIMFAKVGMLSPSGRCRSFAATADGYARADGVGAILLKRLDLAERDGDRILAVIRGSAENHGGAASSLTAPNPRAQAELIIEAHRQAGIDPRSVGLIECHGTGTRLGDPIEIEGLKMAFAELYRERGLPPPSQPHCGLGSVKSNIGHAETAAGIAGLIKVVFGMADGLRYQSLHCAEPNPLIDLTDTPFQLLATARPWPRPLVDGQELPRRAALSSFGAGGANAHLVLEEYRPAAGPAWHLAGPALIPLSARNAAGLRAVASDLLAWLGQGAEQFAGLAFTLQTGRDALRHRLACVAADAAELAEQLAAYLAGDNSRVILGQVARSTADVQDTLPADQLPPLELARRWVEGAPVDWLAGWPGSPPQRLQLPTYPFQRQAFWLPTALPAAAPGGGLELRPGEPGCYFLELTGKEFFLADHRVNGVPVLPGVAYLEVVRRAAVAHGLDDFCIRQMIWQKPLAVTAPVTLEIRLLADSGAWPRVEMSSRAAGGQRQVHAQARLAAREIFARPVPGIDSLRPAQPQVFDQTRIYQAFSAIGLDYGPAHRLLHSLAVGRDAAGRPQLLGELRLPEESRASLDAFGLHPGLLDGAFQATIGLSLGQAEAETALPFALDRVEMHAPCVARMWVLVRQADQSTENAAVRALDLDLFDEAGGCLVSLHGFSTRRLAPAAEVAESTLMFAADWQELPAGPAPAAPAVFARRLAVLGAGADPGALAAVLPAWESQVLAITGATDEQRFGAAAGHLLHLLQEIGGARRPASPVLLQVLLAADQAALFGGLAGMLQTARLEYPWLCGQLLAVETLGDSAGLAALAQRAGEFPEIGEFRQVAGRLFRPAWRELAMDRPVARPWRSDGVYLITGGAGGIGRLLVGDILAQAPDARLIVVGRSAPGGELADWLAARQAAGAKLDYRVADLTDGAVVEALIAALRQQYGRLHGVMHAAGVICDQPLRQKSSVDLDRVLAPKLAGTLHLDHALGDGELDFLVLFSSLSGVFGNPGQADYAAANAFLDRFAEAREARRAAGLCQGRTVAIAWPLWRQGGMRMAADARRLMRQSTGLGELDSAAGVDALARALAGESARLMVLAGDPPRLRQRVAALHQPAAPSAPAPLSAAVEPALAGPLQAALMHSVSRQLKVAESDLDPDVELTEYGFDSISFTQLANDLNERLGLELTPTLFFEYPTLAGLGACLMADHGAAIAARLGLVAPPLAPNIETPLPPPAAPLLPPPPPTVLPPGAAEPIAIIGLSGIFPQAPDLEQFWQNLLAGRDCISEVPAERWDWRDWWGDPATQADRCKIKWGGFIDGMAEFDPGFFGLSGPEARAMDPQQRLLLTQTWRLLEGAGYAPRSLAGSRTGVFIGTADTGYGRLAAAAGMGVEGYSMTGLAPSLGPNRISYFFDFHGPSVAVETACSSALVAIHRAIEAMRGGSCDTAIAGGINALLSAEAFVGFSKAGMLAPDGRCKPFSAEADGYARGEGVGLVFLKPLAAAERDGDRILGVIRASLENHGGRAASLTAPNPRAQAELLRQTWRRAGVDPRTVSYIEAHGTGTPLGDPIEMEALGAAFADLEREAEAIYGPQPTVPCAIGSVKSNIGHLELAAGVAGLSKVLLQMAHGTLVSTLHCTTLNPYLKLADGRFQVVRENRPWVRPRDAAGRELPRRAGVSSFGFGGSNAHLVVEEYLPPPAAAAEYPVTPALILLSARTAEQLVQSARQLAAGIDDHMALAEIAWTLQVGRNAMEHRLAFAASSHAELRQRLLAFAEGRSEPGIHLGQVKANRDTLAIIDGDEEMRRAVASLPARGKHDSLLQLWVRGLLVDWPSLLNGARRPARLMLPGYPFARTRYWPGEGAAQPASSTVVDAVPAPKAAVDAEIAPLVTPATEMPPVAELPVDSAANRVARALAALVDIAARVLEVEPAVLEADTELGEYGFDSITMTGFASRTNAELGLALSPADFFEFATLARLARHIAAAPAFAAVTRSPGALPAARMAASAERRLPLSEPTDDAVAIVGISCRLPMAIDLDAFWQNLVDGRDCISEIPAERWDWREVYGDPKKEPTKTNIRWAGFIDGVFEFDPLFFGISPREAKLMDPQQRLLLTHVWKALEDAGHNPRSFAGRAVGLFVATSSSGYREMIGADTGGEGYVATGAVPSVGPNRVSYFLDWHGPSEPVETACSSSLVALHRALQAMRNGDCEMALVGGVNTIVTPEAHINFAKAGMLSPDGHCHTFSAEANGYARGEGVGMIVLRRLADAQRDGDHIYGLVRGTAINHGGRANSLTAPNTAAQSAVLKAAYQRAGVAADSVGYIEAHGTGTPLGDPVEINALKSAFRDLGVPAGATAHCGIGAVKSSIGHLELAAGMAGIIKVLLQMRHRTLVRSLHCTPLNPYIDLGGSPFFIVGENQPWPALLDEDGQEMPRRAGVSSFGFGGVNAHVVLEEYLPALSAEPVPEPGRPLIVPLSARDETRLGEQVEQLLAAVQSGRYGEADLPDLAWTLQVGREAMKYRLAVVVSSLSELAAELQAWQAGQACSVCSARVESGLPAAVRALPEMAAQWVRGAEVDWPGLAGGSRCRLSLPSYPFARDTYRIGSVPAPSTPSPLPASAALVRRTGEGEALVTLDAQAFYLRDHRVQGQRVLPGALSVELARQAHVLQHGPAPLTLTQVVWQQAVTAGDGALVMRLDLLDEPAGDAAPSRFQLRAGSAPGGVVHVQGLIGPLTGAPAPQPLAIDSLRQRCPNPAGRDWLYERYAALGLDYGPAFRVISELHLGADEFLAHLELPAAAASSETFGIHPVLLDGAFQACLGLFAAPGDGPGAARAALPFVLEQLHSYRPTPAQMWVHGRLLPGQGAVRRIDLDLADAEGRICLQVRGFSLRLLAPQPLSVPAGAPLAGAAQAYLAGLVAAEAALAVEAIEPEAALEAYGIDSIMITRLTERLEQDFGSLPKTLFFEYQTLAALAGYFLANHAGRLATLCGSQAEMPATDIARAAAPASSSASLAADEGIAIIGLAGRYPGANNLEEFWANLAAGHDAISEVPLSRWDHSRYYDPQRGVPGKTNSKWGGFIADHDCFDPLFFNMAPREAGYLDPQERLFLQCAWETLEDAGYTRASLGRATPPMSGASVGVFVGVMYEEYQLYGAESTQRGEPLALSGSAASIANRVSYFCNFHGPSLAVDSMCSSSLAAIHLACESLRAGSCDVALAGGVNLTLHPNKYLALAQGRFTSSQGRCESFGEGGDGYVPGEGVGAALLKPLSRAVADGDRIYGVIRASALNHGGKTNGYAVPNPQAQTAVIERALARAQVDPEAISYIEAHGTGTRLGDPIEIAALTRAFRSRTEARGYCAIGSVKSNIGHAESAAGIAGLSKVLLQMQHGQLVPSLHSARLNPGIDFATTPFVVQQQLAPWPRPVGGARLAGLSSFGAGGSNAHLLIEEYVAPLAAPLPAFSLANPGVFPFSARDERGLREVLRRMRQALARLDDAALPALANGLQAGREAFEQRLVLLATDRRSLLEGLDAQLLADGGLAGRVHMPPAFTLSLAQAGAVPALARQWAAGQPVDWAGLWPAGPRPRKISLPTYPFARQRCWIPGAAEATPARAVASTIEPAAARRSIPPETESGSATPPLLFAPHWQSQPCTASQPPAERRLLVFCEPRAALDASALAALASADCHLLDQRPAPVDVRYTGYAVALLGLLQDLLRERPARALLQVVVPESGEGRLFEGLAGLLRSAQLEHPALRCQLLACSASGDELLGILDQESSSDDLQVRRPAGQRWVRQWQELLPSGGAGVPWKAGGVYLITGGSGGVGLLLAEEIARRARDTVLCLVSRQAPNEALAARLSNLPAHVIHRAVDVGDAAAVAGLIAELQQTCGQLNGIVHAAGLNRDKMLLRKNAGEIREVLAPKVAGLHHLDQASAGCALDFMLLFASATGALGNPGQADYACANAWLDAFASQRNELCRQGRRQGWTLAIDWPYWQDGGMRLSAGQIEAMTAASGLLPLSTGRAMQALDLAWAAEQDQVLVLDGEAGRLRRLLQTSTEAGNGAPAATLPPPDSAGIQPAALKARTLTWLAEQLGEIIGLRPEEIDPQQTVDRYGIDSVLAMQMIEALERDLGPLAKTLLFEYPSLAQLAAALLASHGHQLAALLGDPEPPPAAASQTPDSAASLAPTSSGPTANSERDIAVLAVAGRYPGADSIEAFWDVLREGRDCVSTVPPERWDHSRLYSPEKGKPGSSYCQWGGFLSDVDCFDPAFFGLTPRDAILMDPQERLFLQTVWHLLERAGHPRSLLQEHYAARVGVYVGAMYQPYHAVETDAESRTLVSLSSHASLANRVSFFFDLQGPSVAVDNMCSSGLQAVHLAVHSLQRGECRLAIAGGVNLSLHPAKYLGLAQGGLLGSHADSRSFADGDGYLPAEGVGAVLLKPLADALRDGDPVLAVIKGSAANHGGHSAGYGVPSAEAQARLIEENLQGAGIDPRSISYVEAAANGSALGDALELRALSRAFGKFSLPPASCAIGSVKSNMGHAEAASGLAQLTKVLLQLQHRQLVPGVRETPPNPHLDFAGTPFRLQRQLAAWPRAQLDGREWPRRATVSSFGAGGSNVHLILEEAPAMALAPEAPPRAQRFPLSARDPRGLAAWRALLADYVEQHPDLSLARLAATLQYRRENLGCGCELVASTRQELLAQLTTADPSPTASGASVAPADPSLPPLVLPDYPFAREHYWLPAPAAVNGASAIDAQPSTATPDSPPEILALILDLLASELRLPPEQVTGDTSFRDLGADSMTGLRLIYGIGEATGVQLRHADLRDFPTPAALAAEVQDRQRATVTLVEPAPVATACLSEGQKGLWLWQQLYPASSAYNVPLAFRLGPVDLSALEGSCQAMLDAWPLLDQHLSATEGTAPRWQATKTAPAALLKQLPLPADVAPEAFLRARSQRPFDLFGERPIRFELLRGEPDVLLILVHHIVFDGLSALHFSRYFWQCYGCLAAGRPRPAPPVAADFAEFVGWEQAYLQSPAGQTDLAYWQEQLAGELPVLGLPADHRPEPGQALLGASLERRLPQTLNLAARASARALGIDLSAFFLGALQILLYRYTGQTDILIGVPTLGRPAQRFERSIGYFANLLAIRCGPRGELPAGEFLRTVQARLSAGLDHAAWPFAGLCQPSAAPASQGTGTRLPGQAPLDVAFAWQNFLVPEDLASLAGISLSHCGELRQEGDVPLALEIYPDGETLRLVAVFDQGRFAASRIERLLDHYQQLIASLCAQVETPLGRLEMLTPVERQQLLVDWNVAPAPAMAPGTVIDWIAGQAARTPGATALVVGDQRLTYRQLLLRAQGLALCLSNWGVRPGQPVGVLLERGADSIVALLAVLQTGAIWLPLDADSPDPRLALILQDAAPALVIAEATTWRRLPVETVPVLLIEKLPAVTEDAVLPGALSSIDPDSAAYLIYTSGSTGQPKGVAVAHRALAAHCAAVIEHYRLIPADRVLQFAALHVDAALEQILPSLACGAQLLMREREIWPAETLAAVLDEQSISVADLPPAYLRDVLLAWAREGRERVHCPRLLIVGGEALTPELVRLWRQSPLAGARLLNAYGPTETTITATVHEVPASDPAGPLPIGRPLAGGRVYILDPDGNPLPEGVPGELFIGGERVALGYYGQPALTAGSFLADPFASGAERIYRSGDLASFIPGSQGLISFHGRRDHQLKIRGFRIELGEIEATLRAAGLRDVIVLARKRDNGEPALVVYAVSEGPPDEAALRCFLAARLPAAMLPGAYVFLDALPLTAGGKLDRSALPAPGPLGGDRPEVLADPTERQLAGIWCSLLGLPSVAPGDDFFLCGGHSLLALGLLAALRREFGLQLSMAALLAAPSLRQQAQLLRGEAAAAAATVLVPLRAGVGAPLFCLHPVGGGVGCYRQLADQLATRRPIYGLQSPALDGAMPPADLPAMAACLLAALRTVQATGPYHMIGWSLGGVLAYEMAQQLSQAGERVKLLALIDSYTPALLNSLETAEGPAGLSLAQGFAEDLAAIEGADVVLPAEQAAHLSEIFQTHAQALRNYQPAPYAGAVLLFTASQPAPAEPTHGWREWVRGELSVVELPGDHYQLLQAPGVLQLADHLLAGLDDPRQFAK